MSLQGMFQATCTIERLVDVGVSGYNTPVKEEYVAIASNVRVRYSPRLSNIRGLGGVVGERWGSQAADDLIHSVVLLLFPKDTDINEHDRVIEVRDAKGLLLESGPLDPVLVRPTYRRRAQSHMSVVAKRVE